MSNFRFNRYVYVFFTQFVIIISGILILKIFSHLVLEETMGAYLVIKRIIAIGVPIVSLNLSLSLAKYISHHIQKSTDLFFTALLLMTLLWLSAVLPVYFMRDYLALILLGNKNYAELIMPAYIFIYATSFQMICAGFYRGYQKFSKMNLVYLMYWISAFIPLYEFLIDRDNEISHLSNYFILYSIISVAINLYLVRNIVDFSTLMSRIRNGLASHGTNKIYTNFLKYGVYRLPSGIFAASIFFIPVVAASSSISLKTAAYMGIIVSIFGLLQSLAYPLNLIFLPKFSEYQSRNDDLITKTNSQTVLDFLVTFPLIGGLLVFFMSEEIILLWFGPKYAIVHNYLKILGPFIGFFLAYVLIRGVLDGLYDFPYSNIINFSGVFIISILSYLSVINNWDLLGLSVSFGIGITSIGILSIFILWYRQKLTIFNSRNLLSVLWFFVILIVFVLYSRSVHISIIWYSFILKIGISGVVIVISFYYYKFLKYKWVDNIKIDFV